MQRLWHSIGGGAEKESERCFVRKRQRDFVLNVVGPQNDLGNLTGKMKIASLGLAGGRWYDRNSLRTPTMQESQLLREKTTSSVFLSTCSNAVHAQFH